MLHLLRFMAPCRKPDRACSHWKKPLESCPSRSMKPTMAQYEEIHALTKEMGHTYTPSALRLPAPVASPPITTRAETAAAAWPLEDSGERPNPTFAADYLIPSSAFVPSANAMESGTDMRAGHTTPRHPRLIPHPKMQPPFRVFSLAGNLCDSRDSDICPLWYFERLFAKVRQDRGDAHGPRPWLLQCQSGPWPSSIQHATSEDRPSKEEQSAADDPEVYQADAMSISSVSSYQTFAQIGVEWVTEEFDHLLQDGARFQENTSAIECSFSRRRKKEDVAAASTPVAFGPATPTAEARDVLLVTSFAAPEGASSYKVHIVLSRTITCAGTQGGKAGDYHPDGQRKWTCRELATLASFPTDCKFTGQPTAQRRQIGKCFLLKLLPRLRPERVQTLRLIRSLVVRPPMTGKRSSFHRHRACDFKEVDMKGFLLEEEEKNEKNGKNEKEGRLSLASAKTRTASNEGLAQLNYEWLLVGLHRQGASRLTWTRPHSSEVTLTRGEKGERYFLTLFESSAKPHTNVKLILNRMEGPATGVSFMSALTEFELFFARKTGH
ncbi:DNA (cytosine-5-)-methyltransferase [Apiospora sp. TS-2023a]